MKVGDTVPVTLAGHEVARATVKELADGKAILIVPGTLVTMGVRAELTDLPEVEQEVQTVITDVERTSAPEPAPAPAPVGDDGAALTNTGQTEPANQDANAQSAQQVAE